jgi:cellulose synthase/poly-beta-1,6-N-acetylglucosamine synthase-like glycosyltransferase
MTVELLLVVVSFAYLLQVAVLLYGIRHTRDDVDPHRRPFVSVVIAARNEEKLLPECLRSVLHQTYPSDQFEVIVVNDHSTDGTISVCEEFAGRYTNCSWMNAEDHPRLIGKSNALHQGITKARGEVILITDADCVVPETWVEHTARRYAPRVGIVGGITIQKARTSFEGMQSLDWVYLLGLASAAATLRNPLSTIGNNLSFRKAAYEEVGGYEKIPFSVTEDFMLFQAIVRTGRWEYLYPIDPHLLVTSEPCRTWKDLIRQKKRWGKGGLDMKPSGFVIMAIAFSTHALIAWTILTGEVAIGLSCLFAKLVGDYMFLRQVLVRLARVDLLKYFYRFQAYFFFYVLLLPLVVFFGGKVVWKGRHY